MRKTVFACCLLVSLAATAQMYQPTWESLDKRPVPKWFMDGKFGIFIHWGVYAVPAYTTKGGYAEWYQNGLEKKDSAKMDFHRKKFGDLTYYQLADQFKAELFQPDEWAKVFEKSGARYIVLTSKHHDGFALWPSAEASRTWGFPWNAKETGPKRDLLGDLFKAVRKTKVHAGMYYSLYEWYNPLWKSDPKKYATDHMWPQMKELINNYQPEVFWTDGDWDASEDTWRSKEFLAWLYNESPVKDKIVTYDRWGSGVRFKHGAVFTPEYQPELDFENHAWEESRGMGYSYGYNREEDAWDYNSTQSLIYHLLDKVSRGGNFLLDIGPDEHGKIPPIMQERLLQIGEWLDVNGEAIYNTTRWKTVAQWSAGNRTYKAKKGEDIMMKLTVNPDPGYAVKEVFYTYNAGTNSLYAIFPKYPSNKKLVLHNLQGVPANADIRLLANGAKLKGTLQGTDFVIALPEYNPNEMRTPQAYVVKIGGYGAFHHKPEAQINYQNNYSTAEVTLVAHETGAKIWYRLNDATPQLYTTPIAVKANTKIRSWAQGALLNSDTAVADVKLWGLTPQKAVAVKDVQAGLRYRYFQDESMDMQVLETLKPVAEGIADKMNLSKKQRADKFGLVFDGYIKIEDAGAYTFFTSSDDGSKLWIDGEEIVNNDGNHGTEEKEGRCLLEKGYHRIVLKYFDSGGGNALKVSMQKIGQSKTEIPATALYH
jgi:alpha-L-fucosidase